MTMLLDLHGRVGDVGGDGTALLDEAAMKRSPHVSAMVEDAVLTHEFGPVASTMLFPALLVPRQSGWRSDRGAGRGPDHVWTRTNHWNLLVRVHP